MVWLDGMGYAVGAVIYFGEHFLGTARNLLVQNEKGIMLTINNN